MYLFFCGYITLSPEYHTHVYDCLCVDMCRYPMISSVFLANLPIRILIVAPEASMRSGSVIVDLAAPTGGNCVYTEPNRAVLSPNGVTIVGVAWLVRDGHGGWSWLACRYQCYVRT